jgi:FkbM family methyltransferase
MKYPDAFRWASQVVEVFSDDCYRIGRLPQMPRVVDVGANIGTFSLGVLWHRPGARLIAIEPSPLNLGYLEQNLVAFGAGRTDVIKAAAGVFRGATRLAGDFTDSFRTGTSEGICVQMIPLADVLMEKTDLLKIDIEGAELDALRGAGETLANVDRVVIEYHDYPGVPSSLPELLQLLKGAGFDALEIDSLRRFPSISPDLPIACCLVHGWRNQRETFR